MTPAPPETLVVLVVGVPGAGKTTVARALADRLPRAACIEGDLVQHHFTVSGLVGPGTEPADEAERQIELRWRNCAMLARNFWEAGFTAIVEHAASVRHWIDDFVVGTDPAPVSVVVLAPPLEIALARDRARPEKQVAQQFAHMDAEMRSNLRDVGWWIDTAGLNVSATVDAILDTGLQAGRVR